MIEIHHLIVKTGTTDSMTEEALKTITLLHYPNLFPLEFILSSHCVSALSRNSLANVMYLHRKWLGIMIEKELIRKNMYTFKLGGGSK